MSRSHSTALVPAEPMGVARLSKMAFDGTDLWPVWRGLVDKYIFEPHDAASLMDLAVVEQLFGNLDVGLSRLNEALRLQRIYRSPCGGATPSLRVLAFAAAGDIGSNTPIEFLLDGSDIALNTIYVVPGEPLPDPLPEHDVAIVTIGESDDHQPVLREIRPVLERWSRPVLNRPDNVALLARESLHGLVGSIDGLAIPATVRVDRQTLYRLGSGELSLDKVLPCGAFPIIARPVDSHAGIGLEKLDTPDALPDYLDGRHDGEFYVSNFVDYRSADGQYRKYRIVFIGGKAHACHMAIADQWKVWYLNAGMRENAEKRGEEANFMAAFDTEFAVRHSETLAGLANGIELDYFAIDCAEMPDGDLLLFEADIAMIVHDMDHADVYPYKPAQMQKLFDAFRSLLRRRAERHP